MMTKKDFVKVAAAINRSKKESAHKIVSEPCDEFQEINPHFDRSKFIDACFKEASA